MGFFLKRGVKSRDSGTPRRGFYINPSRRGPAVPGEGFLDPRPGGGEIRAPEGSFRTPGPGTPRRVPRGPGARGWCKTPLARAPGPGSPGPPGSGTGSPVPGGLPLPLEGASGPRPGVPGSWDPGILVPRALGGPSGPGREPRPRGPGGRDRGCFTSTPRGEAPRWPEPPDPSRIRGSPGPCGP